MTADYEHCSLFPPRIYLILSYSNIWVCVCRYMYHIYSIFIQLESDKAQNADLEALDETHASPLPYPSLVRLETYSDIGSEFVHSFLELLETVACRKRKTPAGLVRKSVKI